MGFDFQACRAVLFGSGNWIVVEFDAEIGYHPMIGTNTFKSKTLAEAAIIMMITAILIVLFDYDGYLSQLDNLKDKIEFLSPSSDK